MRFVKKGAEYRTPRLTSGETFRKLLELVRTRNKKLIDDAIYRDSYDTMYGKRSRVEDQLAQVYLYKCAYCERICKSDIEHYRPKGGIDEALDHPGYYWLCYEWTNLLPACITCNREDAKKNHFPVLGARVYPPILPPDDRLVLEAFDAHNSPLIDERPFLLHPELDRPERYLSFVVDQDGKGIRLEGIDPEGRGEKTIAICKLNRNELALDRVENVIDLFRTSVECLFSKLADQLITEELFVEEMDHHISVLKIFATREDKTHTYLRKHIVASVENFEKIVLPFLTLRIRNIVLQAFITHTVSER